MALTADTFVSIPALLAQRAATHAQDVVLRNKQRGIWVSVTWAELATRVRQIGMALTADGLVPGNIVAVLSDTRPEIVCADLGALAIGCISACIGGQDDPDRMERILRDTGCQLLFVENEEQLDKALLLRDRCVALRRIVIFDMKGLRELDDEMCESLAGFLARGVAYDRDHPAAWGAATRAVSPEQPAALVLPPSPETAPQILTQRDILRLAEQVTGRLGQRPGDERVALLPMSGMIERTLGLYTALVSRTVSNYLESAATLIENLCEIQPTVLGAPLAVWERFRERIVVESANATWLQRALFTWAIGLGEASPDGAMAWAARLFVLNSVRQNMGLARLRIACVGTASPPAELSRWYGALGLALTTLDRLTVPTLVDGEKISALTEEFICAA